MAEFEIEVVEGRDDLAELCAMYWDTNADGAFVYTVKRLGEFNNLPAHKISKVVSESCIARSTSRCCVECGEGFTYSTRSEWVSARTINGRCDACRQAERRRAEEKKAQTEATARAEIYARFGVLEAGRTPSAEGLDMPTAFALAALLEDAEEVAPGVTTPVATRTDPFAPTSEYAFELLKSLHGQGLVHAHPSSPLDSFTRDDAGVVAGGIYPLLSSFYVDGSGALDVRVADYLQSFAKVVSREAWPDDWSEQFSAFWLNVAAEECKAYLVHMLDTYGLAFTPGQKTDDVFRKALRWYSIGQVYYFIWRAAKESVAYRAREKVSAKQAANSAVTRISGEIERAYAQGWEVPVYRRNPTKLPISTLSHIFFSRALNLDDPMSYSPIDLPVRRPGYQLAWPKVDSSSFERLIFQLVAEAEGYENVEWLMHTNAPDHGRDVSAVRLRRDPLSGHDSQRVAIQCKHWLSKPVRDVDVHGAIVSLDHWQDPPFDVLIIATSGRFTTDAVAWIERHNARGNRPNIEVWNDARLEQLLAQRPHLIRSFELR